MTPCPLCGNARPADLGGHPDFPGIRIAQCPACGMAYADPTPDPGALAERYESRYREVRGESATEGYVRMMDRRAAAQRAFLLQGFPAEHPRRVLDVGCSAGALLAAFAGEADRLAGFEPDKRMAAAAAARVPGADIRQAVCDPAALPARAYDLITLSHVLEHVPGPVGFVRGLLAALAPGGRVFIEVPNEQPDEVRYLVRSGYRGHMHLSYFVPGTLTRCVEAAGGRVVRLRTAGPTFQQCSPAREQARRARQSWRAWLPVRAARKIARTTGLLPRPKPQLDWCDYMATESDGAPARLWVRAVIGNPE